MCIGCYLVSVSAVDLGLICTDGCHDSLCQSHLLMRHAHMYSYTSIKYTNGMICAWNIHTGGILLLYHRVRKEHDKGVQQASHTHTHILVRSKLGSVIIDCIANEYVLDS